MRRHISKADPPSKLGEVLTQLQQAQRELERIQYASHDDSEVVSLPEDELLKVAKSLAFIWNSRKSFLDQTLIADPGWIILLNLKIAELRHDRFQVTTVCMDSGSPATTALRWIKLLESELLVTVEPDNHDGRRKFVILTDSGSELMGKYLQNIHNFINARGIIF